MTPSDAQKSEVHDATADADGSPTAVGDEQSTLEVLSKPRMPHDPHPRNPVLSAGTHIISDETSEGGPLTIVTDDPELNPPRIAPNPFPTDRTPEIDLPVK